MFLRKYRKAARFSATELATKLGVTVHGYRRWEREEVEPRASQLANLSKILEVSIDDLIFDKPSDAEANRITIRVKPGELTLIEVQAEEIINKPFNKKLGVAKKVAVENNSDGVAKGRKAQKSKLQQKSHTSPSTNSVPTTLDNSKRQEPTKKPDNQRQNMENIVNALLQITETIPKDQIDDGKILDQNKSLEELPNLVSVSEACEYLFSNSDATSKARIYRMIHTKKIEAKVFGDRNYYIPRAELAKQTKT